MVTKFDGQLSRVVLDNFEVGEIGAFVKTIVVERDYLSGVGT